MSIFHVLYETYLKAEEKGQVDNFDLDESGRNIVILPIFHDNKRSSGKDVLQIVINQDGQPDHVNLVSEGVYTIFPVTEKSLKRTKNICAHPLCDTMQYLSKSLNQEKYKDFCNVNEIWTKNIIEEISLSKSDDRDDVVTFLQDIQRLIFNHDLLVLIKLLLAKDYAYEVLSDTKLKLEISPETKKEKVKRKTIDLSKIFITFAKTFADGNRRDLSITKSRTLHEAHSKYIIKFLSQQEESFNVCDITGREMYCANKCRGLLGTSKVIGVSNEEETYIGRFRKEDEVYSIGAETSEKVFLMLKFFLEHKENVQYLYDKTNAVIWFAEDILNKKGFSVDESIPNEELFSFLDLNDEDDEDDVEYENISLSNPANVHWRKLLIGQEALSPEDNKDFFYLIILNQTSKGRIAIQSARTLPFAQFFNNLKNWKDSCCWFRWDANRKQDMVYTPKTWEIIHMVYGLEEDGLIVLRNDELKSMMFRQLLVTILDGRPLPQGLAKRMFSNFSNRKSYPKTWYRVVYMTCALVNKARIDQGKDRRMMMLDPNIQSRDYLYGRLLAICEKIERDATTVIRDEEGKSKFRETNVEKLWTAFFQSPEKYLTILEERMKPYYKNLRKNNPGLFMNLQALIEDVVTNIREADLYEKDKNRPLAEDAVFGYYAQRKDLYTKKSEKKESENDEE